MGSETGFKWEKRVRTGIVLRCEDERMLRREDEIKVMKELFPKLFESPGKVSEALLNLFNGGKIKRDKI